jgi:plasmid stability protein
VIFLHDPLRAADIADRYWPAFHEAYKQTKSLGGAWTRLEPIVTKHKLMEAYGPVVRDLLAARIVAEAMPPNESASAREEGGMRNVQVDPATMLVIDRFRGPMSRDEFVKQAVYQLAYARSRADMPPLPEE